MHGRGTGAALFLVVLAAPCSAGEGERRTWVVRDSAGVTIVENAAPAWGPGEGWKLTAEPVLEVGATAGSPDYEFGRAHGPVRLADGRIVVADMMSNQLSFYDADGRFLKRVGGSGGGPGEFTQLFRLRRIAGDSLMALEPPNITSIFSPDGDFVRRFSLSPVADRGNLWWRGPLAGGYLLVVSLTREGTRELPVPANPEPGVEYARLDVPERPPTYRDSLLHMLFTMDGELVDSIGKWPGQNLNAGRLPFPSHGAYAFEGDRFHLSPGNILDIRTWQVAPGDANRPAATRLRRIIRRTGPSVAVTDSIRDEHIRSQRAVFDRILAGNPGMDPAMFEREIAGIEFPDSIPAHDRIMHADAAGNLWLQEFRVGDAGTFRWSVFDPDGRWLGVVETPASFTVNEIGDDYVLGIGVDTMDVQYVRMYGLVRE